MGFKHQFILLILFIINFVTAFHELDLDYQSVSPSKTIQVHRTGYHFQPFKHWINDPNGPMLYNGIYHLFYQYNPKGAVWGNIVWAHSISKDLINWKHLNVAIRPDKPFDKYGCWSGSATILPNNKPVILYTGVTDQHMTEVQNYAIPANLSDLYLQDWIKPNDNPLITPGADVNASLFRDPTTAWLGQDKHWRTLVGGSKNKTGITYIYKSKDFKKWAKARYPLHSVYGTGNFECPDLFPVDRRKGLDYSLNGKKGLKHVLKVSLDVTRYEYYTIGSFDDDVDKYTPDKNMVDGYQGLRFDYGNFYASKSFYDSINKRRVLWGWSNESDTKLDDVKKGWGRWAGIQAIPRTIVLHSNGKQLILRPIKEVETLRAKKVRITNHKMKKGDLVEVKGITAAQADVEVVFTFSSLEKAEPFQSEWNEIDAQELCTRRGSLTHGGLGPFGLLTLASKNLEEYTPVFFQVFKAKHKYKVLLCSDASRSSLKKAIYRPSYAGFLNGGLNNKTLSLRSLIDNSVVESFGNGGIVCITSRVYPTLAVSDEARLFVFNNGSETITIQTLDAWSMNNASMTGLNIG